MSNTSSSQPNSSWSARWRELLEAQGYDLRRGRAYARRGRVQAVEVQVGRVTATVVDRDRGECAVEIRFDTFSDTEWNRVLDALASEAIYAAQLLAGDMPTATETIFAQAGVTLLPLATHEIETRCDSCARWERPCPHATAVLYVLGQMIGDEPWLLLRLRGRDRQQVLQGLRQRRSDGAGTRTSATVTGDEAEEPAAQSALGSLGESGDALPLAAQIDTFWGRSRDLRELHHHIGPPAIKLALLRRLGHPPFSQHSLEIYDQLTGIYRRVTDEALSLAYAPEPEDEG